MKLIVRPFLFLVLLLVVACNAPTAAPTPTGEPATAEATQPPATTPPTVAPTNTLPPPIVTEQPTEESPIEEPVPTLPPPSGVEAWPADRFGYGVQAHAKIGDPSYTMEVVANQLGMDWVKVQVRWADLQTAPDYYDWGIWDSIVNEAAARGLHLMFSVVTAPEWSRADGDRHGPPDDYMLYNDFLTTLLERYKGSVHAIEVWNEQNLDREWRTAEGVAPENYVRFLQGAYAAIKAVDPNVIVISGALAPTGVHDESRMTVMNDMIWTDEALALGLLEYADCVGVHHNGYNLPPDVGYDEVDLAGTIGDFTFQGPWGNPHPSWSFATTLEFMTQKVQALDPDKKLCVTEFGWASSEGYDSYPQGFEFALDNTLEEQATYIVQAFQLMHDSGDVLLAFLFNFDYGNKAQGPTDDVVPYSIVDTTGAPRPAFSAVAAMEKTP